MMIRGSRGASDIADERLRQIEDERYDALHDDAHDGGELAEVAAELALEHTVAGYRLRSGAPHIPDQWGLARKHPDTRRRLVIAGALIAAEIDRLDRITQRGGC